MSIVSRKRCSKMEQQHSVIWLESFRFQRRTGKEKQTLKVQIDGIPVCDAG